MNNDNLLYALALQNVANIGDIKAKKLLQYCGSPEAIFKERKNNLEKIEGIGRIIINELFNKNHLKAAAGELKFIEDNKIITHYFLDDTYPEKLKHCIDGPIVLFQRGQINLNRKHIISIVGTRKITSHGVRFCESLVEKLAVYDPIIVSGFAYGTDITAQKAAMTHNLQTIGCLAHGFEQVYPKVHKKYVSRIEENGGFYTDFWSTDTFDRNNFLKRNRIIAGLSEATVVIESAEKGGSLVTADIANGYNREIFAVPGRTKDTQSVGCNNLIKRQLAHLLSKPEDIPYILNWKLEEETKHVQKKLFVELNQVEKEVYRVLKEGQEILDIIALKCEMPTHQVASVLLNMELKGVVRPLPGKQFEII